MLAQRSHDPTLSPLEVYAAAAARRWLHGYVNKMRSPVSGCVHRLDELAKAIPVSSEHDTRAEDRPQHVALERAEWRAEVREYATAIVSDEVLAVVAGEIKAAELAAHLGAQPSAVYAATSLARTALAATTRLWHLWQEACE